MKRGTKSLLNKGRVLGELVLCHAIGSAVRERQDGSTYSAGRAFIATCPKCGFERDVIVRKLANPDYKLRCPQCRDRRNAAIVKDYLGGEPVSVIAQRYALSIPQVVNIGRSILGASRRKYGKGATEGD